MRNIPMSGGLLRPMARCVGMAAANGFAYRVLADGSVVISYHRRVATTLRGDRSARFLAEVDAGNPQEVMARWTGNYRRGNERTAKRHPGTPAVDQDVGTVPTELTAGRFVERLTAYRSPDQLRKYERAFRVAEGDDQFIGVRMGQVFALAKEFIELPPAELEQLLDSPIHEVRVGALSIMDKQARRRRTPADRRRELFELYLRRIDRIDNWDLVDLAAPHVVGGYLFDFDRPRDLLDELARSENPWERRTAIVATGYFIRQGEADDTFRIAELLAADDHDLVQKATGWMLREAGKRDRQQLLQFLDRHAARLPRTLLRYAIEHLDQQQRSHYLGMTQATSG